jgi:hypothetical protein
MKVKVFYQDFFLNSMNFRNENLILSKENSFLICEIEMEDELKHKVAERVFTEMNLNPHEHVSDSEKFKKIGHTSMSVGDYLEFPDGEILICGNVGWEER